MAINLLEHGYNDVNAAMPGEFSSLPAGGYVCKVFNAELTKSKAGNLMLVLFIDVAEGDFQGHFKAAADRVKNFDTSKQWDNSGIYRQLLFSNDNKVAPFFKGLLTCFEKSNPNLKLNLANFETSVLRGCLCGFVFASEEYTKKNGEVGTRTFAKFPRSVDDIREGKFTVPELKNLDKKSAPANTAANDSFGGTPVANDDDYPF